MKVISLASLQGGPLPKGDMKSAVLVTIWLVGILACCFIFLSLVRKKAAPIWPEFQRIFYGCLLLLVWYLLIDIDRWMRWNRNSVPFGYIVLAPISETFRVSSTILLLSGTFRVVWREVGQGERKGWRAAAKIISFFSVLPALFYIILFVALAVCWLKFTSLNTIADIATRKAQFQIAMSAIFFGYAMVSVVAATVTWCFRTRSMRGYVIQSRLVVILAALLLSARCGLEFVLSLLVWIDKSRTRQSFQFIFDCVYGILTIAFVICHLIMSNVVVSRSDTGGKDIAVLQSNVRNRIMSRLNELTQSGRNRSPPLIDILRELVALINQGQAPDLFQNSELGPDRNKLEALKYMQRIEREEGGREARLGTEEDDGLGSRASSAIDGLWSRMSNNRNGARLSKASNSSLVSKSSRNFTPVGADPIARPAAPAHGYGGSMGVGTGAGRGFLSPGRPHMQPIRENMGQFDPAESFQLRSIRTGRRPGLYAE